MKLAKDMSDYVRKWRYGCLTAGNSGRQSSDAKRFEKGVELPVAFQHTDDALAVVGKKNSVDDKNLSVGCLDRLHDESAIDSRHLIHKQ